MSTSPQDLAPGVWPAGLPASIETPATSVFDNLEVSARRFPDKAAIVYYGTVISYRQLLAECEALAGYLQQQMGVRAGDRVMLYLANSPQYVIGYYAVLRADAVVVPVNPMNRSQEVAHIASDCGARVAIVATDLLEHVAEVEASLDGVIVASYRDYLGEHVDAGDVASFSAAAVAPVAHATPEAAGARTAWHDALATHARPSAHTSNAGTPCVIPYSSGTTGAPKGCLHLHGSVNAMIVAYIHWLPYLPGARVLSALPMFHVAGMQNSMNAPLYAGATLYILTRWDRALAMRIIERERITIWRSITTMAIDFFSAPEAEQADLSSLVAIGGGGAQVPEAVALRMEALTGLPYVEGFGMSETISATHINPTHRAKPQCLGVPLFDVDCRVIDPDSLAELPRMEVGEIVVSGPQVFAGYWNRPQETAAAFIERDGRRFLRTGDLGYEDHEGYFFAVDRMKRMINASGFKVWPAEVEALMHAHPAVSEACVIATRDPHRGESVKALVVRADTGALDADALIGWCREQMATYKVPRHVEFVDSLPRSGVGKVLWRELQLAEDQRLQESIDA